MRGWRLDTTIKCIRWRHHLVGDAITDTYSPYSGHINHLRELGEALGANERTLRRAVDCGLIRAERHSRRRLAISLREQDYVRRHWALLGPLRRALRTEANVRLAVVFGSVARGDDGPHSDVDVLVRLRADDVVERAGLAIRLGRAIEREVQLVPLAAAEGKPGLLADALEEGRVLVDRDRDWPELKARETHVRGEAEHADDALFERAREAVEYLREVR